MPCKISHFFKLSIYILAAGKGLILKKYFKYMLLKIMGFPTGKYIDQLRHPGSTTPRLRSFGKKKWAKLVEEYTICPEWSKRSIFNLVAKPKNFENSLRLYNWSFFRSGPTKKKILQTNHDLFNNCTIDIKL